MGRSTVQPSTNKLIDKESNKKIKKISVSPSENSKTKNYKTRNQVIQQSIPPKKSLYNDTDSDATDDEGANNKSTMNNDKVLEEYYQSVQDCIEHEPSIITAMVLKTDKNKIKTEQSNKYPDNIQSYNNANGLRVEHINAANQPLSTVSIMNHLLVKTFNDEGNHGLPSNIKAMLISAIRTQIFRKIKFLTNEKLSKDSSVFQEIFKAIGFHNQDEQNVKYETIRFLVQRQMNSKRNYCTDQIMAKARELMKKKKMFDCREMEYFYDEDHFNNNSTRQAWYIFCFKFVTCVNGDWLKSLNAANARNQVNMFRWVTVSDEAFVRWVLECKRLKLDDEEKNGWQNPPRGRKPCGMHDSRQYSQRYAEIHSYVKTMRNKKTAPEWNNLFWSMYRLVHPKLFVDPSSVMCDSVQGFIKVQQPEEDEYDPQNDKETKLFGFEGDEESKHKEYLLDIV